MPPKLRWTPKKKVSDGIQRPAGEFSFRNRCQRLHLDCVEHLFCIGGDVLSRFFVADKDRISNVSRTGTQDVSIVINWLIMVRGFLLSAAIKRLRESCFRVLSDERIQYPVRNSRTE